MLITDTGNFTYEKSVNQPAPELIVRAKGNKIHLQLLDNNTGDVFNAKSSVGATEIDDNFRFTDDIYNLDSWNISSYENL